MIILGVILLVLGFLLGFYLLWAAGVTGTEMASLVITITPGQAQPGDVVLAPDKKVYQYNGNFSWSHMDLVGYYGAPWTPQGDLELLVRDGERLG